MRTYKFIAKCKSGQVKDVEFQASGYLEARTKLQQFIDNN
jgi:hypothetical protein